MVEGQIHGVDTDEVGVQCLQVRQVTLATSRVGQRIIDTIHRAAGGIVEIWLIGDPLDEATTSRDACQSHIRHVTSNAMLTSSALVGVGAG